MNWLKPIWSELIGLFLDDGSFALSILIWLIACGLVLPRLGLLSFLPPVILFIGLVVILTLSAMRRIATVNAGTA
jgi:hypothetical protein